MKKTVGVVLSVLIALLLGELAARAFLWMPPLETDVGTPRQGLTADAVGDWVPNQHAIWENGRLEYPFFVHINGAGFRNLEELNPEAFRVLVLGDSQTFGLFVASHDIWTNVAEKRLRHKLGREIQLLNNGIPGSTITDHLAYLNEKGERLGPDTVILTVSSNNIVDLRRAELSIGSLRSEWIDSHDNVALRSLRWFLRHHSGLYVAARTLKEKFIAERHVCEVEARGLARVQADVGGDIRASDDLVKAYAGHVKDALARVRALGAEPVLFLLAAPWEPHMVQLRSVLGEIAATETVRLIDTGPAFAGVARDRATWYRDPEVDPDYTGDPHYNRFGNLVIGEYLAEMLAPLADAGVR